MSEYIVLLLGNAEREKWWGTVSEQERTALMAEHERFGRELEARGHTITGGAELHPSTEARSITPGGAMTDGPYAETSEMVGGFYMVETADLDDLVECCKILAATGEAVEVRRCVQPEERAS